MPRVLMYTSSFCGYCVRAKRLLEMKGIAIEEIRVNESEERLAEMVRRTGRHTVPQIFIDDLHVGGCDDLYALDRARKLDPLLGTG